MKIIKIILGILLSYGLVVGAIIPFFQDLANGTEGAILLGEGIGIILMGALIYYLFSTASNSSKNNKDLSENE